MKLKKEFITHNSGNEAMLVSTGKASFSGMVKGNKTTGEIFELLKKDTTEAEIVKALRAKYEAPEGVIEKDVRKVLLELKNIGALEK
ncbi:MAG: PqqD family protein [Ruminococcus sp.]|jgi:hypothetical protein|nr:PqqD family protein [Ruminococcus sp.]